MLFFMYYLIYFGGGRSGWVVPDKIISVEYHYNKMKEKLWNFITFKKCTNCYEAFYESFKNYII